MESIIEAEIDFGFQFRAERFILALKLLRADARSGRAWRRRGCHMFRQQTSL